MRHQFLPLKSAQDILRERLRSSFGYLPPNEFEGNVRISSRVSLTMVREMRFAPPVTISISVSISITISRSMSAHPDDLRRWTDAAMCSAKV